jgi:hypothetical protein
MRGGTGTKIHAMSIVKERCKPNDMHNSAAGPAGPAGPAFVSTWIVSKVGGAAGKVARWVAQRAAGPLSVALWLS